MAAPDSPSMEVAEAAKRLAIALAERGCEYALGGALALGYWAEPRGTLDVDLTLYVPPDQPTECIDLLLDLGCTVDVAEALKSLREHCFCRTAYHGVRLDVFLPTIDFHELARQRRARVQLADHPVWVWDAEVLCVFKMLFYRRKDLTDVEQVLRVQGAKLDRAWVRDRLVEVCGRHDPRVAQWDELCAEVDI